MTTRSIGGHVIDFGDMPDADIDKLVQTPAFQQQLGGFQRPPAAVAPGTGWAQTIGREAGIFGANALAPIAGTPGYLLGGSAFGVPLPSYGDIRALGPTPETRSERALAAAGTAFGAAAPTLALMGGAGLGAAGFGAVRALPLVLGATTGAGVTEARRQFLPNMPLGPAVDVGLGAVTGGLAGRIGAGAGAAPTVGGAIRGGFGATIGTMAGEAAEWVARDILGLPPWAAQAISVPIGGLVGGGAHALTPQMSAPGAIAGGTAGLLMGPPPQP